MTEDRILKVLMIAWFALALVNEWRRLRSPMPGPSRVIPLPIATPDFLT